MSPNVLYRHAHETQFRERVIDISVKDGQGAKAALYGAVAE